MWEIFRNYHYLNTEIYKGSEIYTFFIEDSPVAFCAVMPLIGKVKNRKRVHRLVVLPDYQGIGIGTTFLTKIGEIYKKRGYTLFITTALPSLYTALKKRKEWICFHAGRCSVQVLPQLRKSQSANRFTYSFRYTGKTI